MDTRRGAMFSASAVSVRRSRLIYSQPGDDMFPAWEYPTDCIAITTRKKKQTSLFCFSLVFS